MLSTSTSLQCICSLIPELLVNVIFHNFSVADGSLYAGNSVSDVLQKFIEQRTVQDAKQSHTLPVLLPSELQNSTLILAALPSSLSVLTVSGFASRSYCIRTPRCTRNHPVIVATCTVNTNYKYITSLYKSIILLHLLSFRIECNRPPQWRCKYLLILLLNFADFADF